MEKGKRYDLPGIGRAHNCEATEDPEGTWLYDPDKDSVPFSEYKEAMERNTQLITDLEAAEERNDFLVNQVTDLANSLKHKKNQIASLEKRNEKLFESIVNHRQRR